MILLILNFKFKYYPMILGPPLGKPLILGDCPLS